MLLTIQTLVTLQTFSALCMLIENLTPKSKELENQSSRTSWLNKVHLYRPVIENVLNLHMEDPEVYGRHSAISVKLARLV